MHLVRGMTTINTKKRKTKGVTQRDRDAQVEHDKWLRKMGVHPEQLKARPSRSVNTIPNYSRSDNTVPTSDVIPTGATKQQSQEYTGERKLLGIATMHKSNMVPVFEDNKEAAKEIAQMRRN